MGSTERLQGFIETGGWYALLLYTALLPFRFFAPLRLTTPRGILLILVALSLALKAHKREWKRSSLDIPLLALLAATTLSSLFSVSPPYSLHSIKREMFPFLLLFWGVYNMADPSRKIRELTLTLIASCILVVMLSTLVGHYEGPRFKGIFPYPTQVGKYMDMVIPLLGGVAASHAYPTILRLGVVAVLVASATMVVLSQTRTSILLMLLSLGSLAISLRRKAVWTVALLITFTLALVVSNSPRIKKRVIPLLTSPMLTLQRDQAMRERYRLYCNTIELIKTRPLLGWGYGRNIGRKIAHQRPAKAFLSFWHSHNILLEVTLQCGLVGLSAFLWLLARLFKEVLVSLKEAWARQDPENLGYILGLTAIGLHSLVSIPQWGTTLLIAVFMGVVVNREALDGT